MNVVARLPVVTKLHAYGVRANCRSNASALRGIGRDPDDELARKT
jgi:hypothetical protein